MALVLKFFLKSLKNNLTQLNKGARIPLPLKGSIIFENCSFR